MPRARLWWVSAARKGRDAACFDRDHTQVPGRQLTERPWRPWRPWEFITSLRVRPSSGNGTKLGNRPRTGPVPHPRTVQQDAEGKPRVRRQPPKSLHALLPPPLRCVLLRALSGHLPSGLATLEAPTVEPVCFPKARFLTCVPGSGNPCPSSCFDLRERVPAVRHPKGFQRQRRRDTAALEG